MANTWHTVMRMASGSNSLRPARHEIIPQPEELGKQVEWEVAGTWFPDSTRFVVTSHPAGFGGEGDWDSAGSSIWMVSILGGPPQKLRDNAVAYSVSPDGSLVGFGTNKGRFGDREIWLMGSNGEQARKLFDTDEESSIAGLWWSSDGKRVLYVEDRSVWGHSSEPRSQKRTAHHHTWPESNEMGERLFFGLQMDGSSIRWRSPTPFLAAIATSGKCSSTGTRAHRSENPERSRIWSGFCMSGMSITADGKKLAFLKWAGKQTSFLAELAAGGRRILTPRHFPLSESSEGAGGLDARQQIRLFHIHSIRSSWDLQAVPGSGHCRSCR